LERKVKAAVLTGRRKIETREFDKPKLKPRDLLMRVKYCGVCGSDIHIWDGHWNPPYPLILGHEFIGEVAEAGDEALKWRRLEEGDQIAVEMILPCRSCEWCLRGYYNLCRQDYRPLTSEYGAQYGCNISTTRPPALWGGYAQHLYVPENAIVHRYEKRVEWTLGALTEPLAVCIRAVERSRIGMGDSAAVVGPGTIGLLTVVAAKAAGAEPVILAGTRDVRLKIGKELGADCILNIGEVEDPVKEVMELTDGVGVDVVFETAGTPRSQRDSFKMARRGGTVVLVGLTGDRELTITPDADVVSKELNVKGSFLSAHAYGDAVKLIGSRRFALDKIVTHRFPLEDVEKAFRIVVNRENGVIKAVLDPWMSDME